MKVLLIDTSEEEGILAKALRTCSDLLRQVDIETEIKNVSDVHPCTSCGKCLKRRRCLFDGPVNEINDEADTFDGMIVGSDVIYGEISKQTKDFLNCLFRSCNERYVNKAAGCILYERKGRSEKAIDAMHTYFSYSCMPVVEGACFVSKMDENDLKEIQMLVDQMILLLKQERKNDVIPDKLVDFMRGR